MKLYQAIANGVVNAAKSSTQASYQLWVKRLRDIERNRLPSGSGVDNGTQIDVSASTPERLVMRVSFHHMNEHGVYEGWTNHNVIVTPSLLHGINIRITGRDRNGIKEYLGDLFYDVLNDIWQAGE